MCNVYCILCVEPNKYTYVHTSLQATFARYIARNSLSSVKRYAIQKVYRENRPYSSHPKELMACSFDIVSPTIASLVPDAEAISVGFEIINEFPKLQARNYYLRINHTSLIKAVLLHCGVPEERHSEVYAILGDSKVRRLCYLSKVRHIIRSAEICLKRANVGKKSTCLKDQILERPNISCNITGIFNTVVPL